MKAFLKGTIARSPLSVQRALYDLWFRLELFLWLRRGPRKIARGLNIVILNHHYSQDIEAYTSADTDFQIWEFQPFKILRSIRLYLCDREPSFNDDYVAGKFVKEEALYVERVIEPTFRALMAAKVDIFITPSDIFYWLRPLIKKLKEAGVTIVVQDKEGTLAGDDYVQGLSAWIKRYYPPICHRVYCWNETSKNLWLSIGMRPDDVFVLGQPRSDFFFHASRWPKGESLGLPEGRKRVLFFTFEKDAYLERERMPWSDLRDAIDNSLVKLAKRYPEVDWLVKPHPQQRDFNEVVNFYQNLDLPNIFTFTGAAISSHLLVVSDVIIGFQTTALMEAMFLNKPILYVGWGATHDNNSASLIPIAQSGACFVPQSSKQFESMIEGLLAGSLICSNEMYRDGLLFREKYFANADGTVAGKILKHAAEFHQLRSE